MATLEEIVVQLTAEVSGLKAGMSEATKSVTGATDKMDKAVEEFSKNSSKNTSFFQTSMATMAGFLGSQAVLGAFNAVRQAASFLAGEFLKGVDAAGAQDQSFKQLANSLALNGQYTVEAQKALEVYIDLQERQTGIQDDVIASNLAVLSSITKLDSEGLQKAQTAALDLSAALGKDLNTTTQMIAKGIEGNTAAFSKFGITVEEGATKSQRLDNILKALANTQGTAEGAAKTYEGTIKQISNSYENLLKEFGKSIVQNPVVLAGLQAIADILGDLADSAKNSGPTLKEFVAETFLLIVRAAAEAAKGLDVFIRTFSGAANAAGLMDQLIHPIDAVGEGLANLVKGQDPFERIRGNVQGLDDAINKPGMFSVIGDNLTTVGDKAEAAFGKLGEVSKATAPSVEVATEKVKELTAAEMAHIEVVKTFGEELAKQGESLTGQYDFQNQLYKEMLDAKAIDEMTYYEISTANLLNKQAAEKAALDEARATNLLLEGEYQNALLALEQKHTLESKKLENDKNKKREADLKSSLDTIATLQNSSSKELAAIGKAAAIYQATVDGQVAVTKALTAAPPPFNFALAAAVGVAVASNIAKIAGAGLAKGIDSVPGIGDTDNFPAVLAPGERVVPKETNQDLTRFLENAGIGGGPQEVTVRIEFIGEAAELIEAKILERQKLGISLLGAPLGAT